MSIAVIFAIVANIETFGQTQTIGLGIITLVIFRLLYDLNKVLIYETPNETHDLNEGIIFSIRTGSFRFGLRTLLGSISIGLVNLMLWRFEVFARNFSVINDSTIHDLTKVNFVLYNFSPPTSILYYSLIFGITISIIMSLRKGEGWRAVLQHVILRRMLKHENRMPTNYADFLNYTAELRLLVRVGGGVKFLHADVTHRAPQNEVNYAHERKRIARHLHGLSHQFVRTDDPNGPVAVVEWRD